MGFKSFDNASKLEFMENIVSVGGTAMNVFIIVLHTQEDPEAEVP